MVSMVGRRYLLTLAQANPNVLLPSIPNPTHCKTSGPLFRSITGPRAGQKGLEPREFLVHSIRCEALVYFVLKYFPGSPDDRLGLGTPSLA